MNNGTQYKQEVEKSKSALADLRKRGTDAIGGSWDELEKEFFTRRSAEAPGFIHGEEARFRRFPFYVIFIFSYCQPSALCDN